MAEVVVADAGPLIAFGRLRKLDLLGRLFEKVIVPRAVFEETQFRPDLADARAILAARQSGVLTIEESSPGVERLPPMSSSEKGKRRRYRLPRSVAMLSSSTRGSVAKSLRRSACA